MRLVSYKNGAGTRPGIVLDEDTVLDIASATDLAKSAGLIDADMTAPSSLVELIALPDNGKELCKQLITHAADPAMSAAAKTMASLELAAPIPRPLKNVFCVGSNYRAHVSEASRAQKVEDKTPKLPVFFTKPPTSVIGPQGSVLLDPSVSDKMDYEVELGVVIGKAGRNITAENAHDHIYGFTIINDVTARDLQRAHGGQFLKGKGLDTTCPMGPCIVTKDELADFENLRISIRVNGETRQDGNTRDMIFPIARLLESLSEGLTLEPGDILATGTPSGVGYAMDPPSYLKDGDEVSCEIEGIGQLTNFVRS